MPTLYRMLVTAASRMACDEVRVGDYLKDVLYPVQYSTAFVVVVLVVAAVH